MRQIHHAQFPCMLLDLSSASPERELPNSIFGADLQVNAGGHHLPAEEVQANHVAEEM